MDPIFVITCVRSGSTLLRCLLDVHPEIYSPGEIGVGQLCQSLYTTVLYTKGQSKYIKSEYEREQVVVEEVRKIIFENLNNYTFSNNKKLWCDKSPQNIDYLDFINSIFPNSKFICLYRNCLDVVHSCILLNKMGFMPELREYVKKYPDNLVIAMMEYWIEKTKKILKFEIENPHRCFRVNYESLVLNPKTILSNIYQFLDVEDDIDVSESIFSGDYEFGQMNGDLKLLFSDEIYTKSVGKGLGIPRTFISEEYFNTINEIQITLDYPSMTGRGFCNYVLMYKNLNITNDLDISNKVTSIFKVDIPRHLQKDKYDFSGSCKFMVAGCGEWVVNFYKRQIEILSGGDSINCVIAVSAKSLIDIFEGRQTVIEAYESGFIGAEGDINMAIKVVRALFH